MDRATAEQKQPACFAYLTKSHRITTFRTNPGCAGECISDLDDKLLYQAKVVPAQDILRTNVVWLISQTIRKPVHLSVVAVRVVTHADLVKTLAFAESGLDTPLIDGKFE